MKEKEREGRRERWKTKGWWECGNCSEERPGMTLVCIRCHTPPAYITWVESNENNYAVTHVARGLGTPGYNNSVLGRITKAIREL